MAEKVASDIYRRSGRFGILKARKALAGLHSRRVKAGSGNVQGEGSRGNAAALGLRSVNLGIRRDHPTIFRV